MDAFERLDKNTILEEKVFQELFDEEDEIKKARLHDRPGRPRGGAGSKDEVQHDPAGL